MSAADTPLLSDPHQQAQAPMEQETNTPSTEDPEKQLQPKDNADDNNNNTADDDTSSSSSTGRSVIAMTIVVVVTGVCFAISYPTSTWYECLVAFAVNWISFLFIAWPLHTEKYYDFTGMLTFLACDFFSILYNRVPWNIENIRSVVLFCMVLVWTLRLGLFLFKRITAKHGGKDARFDELRNNFPRFAVAWTLQAVWGYFCTMPLFIVNQIDNASVHRGDVANVTVLDIVGWSLWVFGWGFEVLADRQKTVFKNDENNRGKFCNVGLWSISRHPNYFGEIMLWIGIFVSSCSVLKNAGWTAVLSPLYTILLLVFVSGVPMAERAAMKKYGNLEAYQRYVREVSVLVPLPCCWKGYI